MVSRKRSRPHIPKRSTSAASYTWSEIRFGTLLYVAEKDKKAFVNDLKIICHAPTFRDWTNRVVYDKTEDMKKTKIQEGRRCPRYGKSEDPANYGHNKSSTQRCKCKCYKHTYTLAPKERAYSEEIRTSAIKTYYSGVSGRGVGKVYEMSKVNAYNWIKKPHLTWIGEHMLRNIFEINELYWYVG